MIKERVVETAKSVFKDAVSTATLVRAHGKDLAMTGVHILQSAKDVVVEGGNESVRLFDHTRSELKRTLFEGADQLRYKLSHIKTPTQKEQASARKLAVKEKKHRKRAAMDAQSTSPQAS